MASSKRRLAIRKRKAQARAAKEANFERHKGDGPNPNSRYGKRVAARLRGVPMAERNVRPWFWRLVPMGIEPFAVAGRESLAQAA